MAFRKYFKRVRGIDELIRKGVTGTVEELAQSIHLSRSALEKEMRDLRDLGVPVIYDKKLRRLRYEENGSMVKHLFEQVPDEEVRLSKEELKRIKGGLGPSETIWSEWF